MSPKYYLLIAALALLLTALTARSATLIGASQALLSQNATVLAKIVVGDLGGFAPQYGAMVRAAQIDLGGRSIAAVNVTIGGVELYGSSSGGISTLYYRGPASWLLKIVYSPYVTSIYVKAMPEALDEPAADAKSFVGEGLPAPALAYIREIIGASAVQRIYGVNGSGVVIAIVDTGVDYGNPDLQGALAWLIKLADGTEIEASSVSVSGSSLAYVDLRGRPGSVPLSAIASLEPLVLDADESQVVLLRGLRASGGYLQTAGSRFAVIDGPIIEVSTAKCNYYVGGLKSSSGVYKFGIARLYIPWLAWYYGSPYVSVGVVMYDPDAPGVYTRMRVDINNDCNFTNDPELSYFGNRLIVDNLTSPTVSLGVAGGYFYDWATWFDAAAKFYPGWDLSGNYISIFYDFFSHGTACASSAAGRGVVRYKIGLLNMSEPVRLTGVAPGAKVLGVKALWWGMVEPGMLWAAGFDVADNGQWYWTGHKRAQIISNSWGISQFTYDLMGFGFDFESAVVNALAAPGFLDKRYPGIVVVQAGGNGGYGFGTITSPGAAVGAITVGAATSGHFWWGLGAPLGGLTQFRWGDIISWSLRGPAPAGYVKPDVVDVGAFGWTDYPVGWGMYAGYGPGNDYDIFGGTSMATPLTAGVAALVLSSLGDYADAAGPGLVKQIIASSAADIGYTPFTAGSGLVNATAAVTLARAYFKLSAARAPVALFAPSTDFSAVLSGSWDFQWRVDVPLYFGYFLNNLLTNDWIAGLRRGFAPPQFQPAQIYLPYLRPGSSASATVKVYNPTDGVEVVSAQAYALVPTYRAYAVVVVPVRTIGAYLTMQQLGFDEAALRQSDLVVFRISYSFKYFDPEFDYRNNVRPVLWVFGWVDLNRDGRIQPNELIWYNYGYQRGTEVEVPVAKLGDRMQPGERLIIRVDVRPTGAGPYPAAVPVTVEVVAYKRAPAPDVSVSPGYAVLEPGSGETFTVTVRSPADAAPTAFERVVAFAVNGTTYVVPLSYTVVRQAPTALTAGRTDSWYNASALRGGNDWGWRYESGDWRAYYIVSAAPNLAVSFSWQCANTSLAAYALTGDGFFAGYFFNQGVSYSATTYIGSGRFLWASTGGATRLLITPSSNFAVPIQAVGLIYATMSASWPVQSAGLYILLARTTNYGGCGTAEALSGSAAPLTAGPSVPEALMPGPIKANLGIPSLPYLFAVKSAAVLGGGYVVPSYTIGLDLKFRDMVYVSTPTFVDLVALLYAPRNYWTYIRLPGGGFNYYPWYTIENIINQNVNIEK